MNKDIFDVDKAYFVIDSNNLDTVETQIYGFAVEEYGIIDEDNLPKDRELSLSGNGTYVYIYRERERESREHIVIHQDFNGSYGLYLFREGDYFAISNSFLYLVDHIKKNYKLTLDRDFANELFLLKLTIETNKHTILNEISLLQHDIKINIDISTKNISILQIDNSIHYVFVDTPEGIELLDRWFSKWTGIIYNIIEQNRMAYINLSGGFDSRITFMLSLLSSANLCKTKITSTNDKLHCHAEDFEIASSIANYFNFSLNKSYSPKYSKIEYFSLRDILNICFYSGKLFFHKEMRYKYTRYANKMFNMPGFGGGLIRLLYNINYEELKKNYLKSACERYTLNTCNEISQSIDKLFDAMFSYLINKYDIKDFNEPDIMYWFYRESRSRHHFGKSSVESFHSNMYSLQPFFDPILHRLNRSSSCCSDPNLLITIILSRYCPELLKFKVQGNRHFESNTIDYANKINKQFPVDLKKLVPNKQMNKFCIIDKPSTNLNTTNTPVNKEEPDNFLMNAFSSRKFFKSFTRYFNEDIYNFAKNHTNKSNFFPMRHCYSVIATVLALDIVDANRNIMKGAYINDLHILSHDENTYDENQEIISNSLKTKKKSPAKNLMKLAKYIFKKLK